ncbi:MAG: DUF2851 family protein [Verrucomicrobiae bacterium]|nr:DUF2851 family protein [Verrucomicrobiae bacterium]
MSGQGTPTTRYGQLRAQLCGAPHTIHVREPTRLPVPERLLQLIWQEQRLRRPLQTADGQQLDVLFPGWWSGEAGPDFRHAILRLNQRELRGDVEVHVHVADWFQHKHDRDPRYANVVLHVVFWNEPPPRQPLAAPVVVLAHQLETSLEDLRNELDAESTPARAPACSRQCARALRELPSAKVQQFLAEAGQDRLERKAYRFRERLKSVPVPQAFYEGWMEALGYKANKTGFRLLARRVPWWPESTVPVGDRAGVLFGVAGFLPVRRADSYTRALWSRWWRWRGEFEERTLPPTVWSLSGSRPTNHPHRRLGAATVLLEQRGDLWPACLRAIEARDDPAELFMGLQDDYWSRHCTLGGRAVKQPTELIGRARAEEIAINVVFPFALAVAGNNPTLAAEARNQFAQYPPSAPNSLLRRAVEHLLPDQSRALTAAAHQQGLLQVFEDFCLNPTGPNGQCRLPELVERWRQES